MTVFLRGLTIAALFAGTAALVQAPSGTLILTSGDRIAGIISFQGDAATPHQARTFYLRRPDGQRQAVSLDAVAAIDIAGGKPSAAELDTLGADTPHVMTLRNGNSRPGRLVGLISGEFVRWETPEGLRVNIPVRNINRIYLNQERALALFEFNASRGRGPRWPTWLGGGLLTAPAVIVDASVPWVDSGMSVQSGDRLRFSAVGGVRLSRMAGDTSSPAGRGSLHGSGAPLPDAPVGALIGRIGDAGSIFAIAIGGAGMEMAAAGRLYLGVNDPTLTDNSGSYRVTIDREKVDR